MENPNLRVSPLSGSVIHSILLGLSSLGSGLGTDMAHPFVPGYLPLTGSILVVLDLFMIYLLQSHLHLVCCIPFVGLAMGSCIQ
jgi:hypothetical protein